MPDSNDRNIEIAADIFAEYGDYIRTVILYKVRDKDIAEDIYQDLFLSIASQSPQNIRNMKSYLYRAVINHFADIYRKKERQKKLIEKYGNNTDFVINKQSPTNVLINKYDKIMHLVRGRLSPTQAKIMALKYEKDFSNKDIAKKIGIKKESVSRNLCVGLKKIREILTHEGNFKE